MTRAASAATIPAACAQTAVEPGKRYWVCFSFRNLRANTYAL
jgi:hypothetical protein